MSDNTTYNIDAGLLALIIENIDFVSPQVGGFWGSPDGDAKMAMVEDMRDTFYYNTKVVMKASAEEGFLMIESIEFDKTVMREGKSHE